jgi:hypothetical protein
MYLNYYYNIISRKITMLCFHQNLAPHPTPPVVCLVYPFILCTVFPQTYACISCLRAQLRLVSPSLMIMRNPILFYERSVFSDR